VRFDERVEDPLAGMLARIARGDKAALETLYHECHARVHAFVLKRVGDPVLAAEILNDVMLTVWRQADRFAGRSRALTWILGIAHNKVLDALRRRGRDAALETLDEERYAREAGEGENTEGDAAAALAALDDAALLRTCLEGLSEAQRVVVHLAFFEDLGYAEIAEIAHCPVGTVKTRMHHARKALKRCLERASLSR